VLASAAPKPFELIEYQKGHSVRKTSTGKLAEQVQTRCTTNPGKAGGESDRMVAYKQG
jgi:hypothetical protein